MRVDGSSSIEVSQMTSTNAEVARAPADAPRGGYHGCYLRIDVGAGAAERVPIAPTALRAHVGGVGLGVYLLSRENAAAVEPLAPAAPLAFVFSPLVGSPLTTSAKFAVVCRSPLTGRINDSLSSSRFAIAGKSTGADAIVVVGRASEPSLLVVDNGEAQRIPAGDLWGLDCDECQQRLRDRFGATFQFAVIGPAGERLARFASISHDGRHAGRGGSGAVLGSKLVKAIVVRGDRQVAWADPKQLVAYAKELSRKSFGSATAKYRELGTAANLLAFNRLHALPTRNFQQGSFDAAEQISPEQLAESREKTRASCAACTIGCEHLYGIRATDKESQQPADDSAGAGKNGHDSAAETKVRMEYENLFALGPLCGIGDPDVVLRASHRCDQLGMDTISAGGTIAFAMECVERGWLDEPWLRFGDGDSLLRAIEAISTDDPFGARLAQGSRRLAAELGDEAMKIAPQVKGLEIPGYEPRALQTMGLGFAVGSRGADHNRSGAYEVDFSDQVDRRNPSELAAGLAIATEDKAALIDSLILCKFLRGVFEDLYAEAAKMLRLITGWDITASELKESARAIIAAKKRFNILSGWQPNEDSLPERFFAEALPDDPRARLDRDHFAALVRAYNLGRGWTAEGWIQEDRCDS